MTQPYRKLQIESARGYKGRPIACHRAVLREWEYPGATTSTIIDSSEWRPHQSGLAAANRWAENNRHREDPCSTSCP